MNGGDLDEASALLGQPSRRPRRSSWVLPVTLLAAAATYHGVARSTSVALVEDETTRLTCSSNASFALCSKEACEAIPGTNLSWCECEMEIGVGRFTATPGNRFLEYSSAYRRVEELLVAGEKKRATELFCDLDAAWWADDIVPRLPKAASVLSLATAEFHDDNASPRTADRDDCRVWVAACIGAPCYRTNITTAMCACPIKYVDVPAEVVVEKAGRLASLDAACDDPVTCGLHVDLLMNSYADVLSMTPQTVARIHDDMLALDVPEDPFSC